MELKERIECLLRGMNRGVYEKNTEIALALLAALAGESILLLGPPGVAKSMVARRLKKAFENARAFEYLMSRFSTPDEIFGPVSIKKLKDSDRYERVIDGYLPTADVVFLDEIWKAGPAIQNTLLTVINEKLFRNGEQEIRMPLKLLVAASNELPTQGEGLEALWDRFMIRIVCGCIKDEDEFYKMLLDEEKDDVDISRWQISGLEYEDWQRKIAFMEVPGDILKCITTIRKALAGVDVIGAEKHRSIYVSDRRWKKIVGLMKASAFINGRQCVEYADMLMIYHCLWNEPDEIDGTRKIVVEALFSSFSNQIAKVSQSLKADLRVTRVNEVINLAKKRNDHRDDDLLVVDNFYYQIENHRTGNSFIFIVDFKNLAIYNQKCPPPSTPGVMYDDPLNPKRTIIRAFALDKERTELAGAEKVNLLRDDRNIYINGVKFPMRRLTRGEIQPELEFRTQPLTECDYIGELEDIATNMDCRMKDISSNMFVSDDDKKCMDEYLKSLRKQIAFARVDANKLM